MRINCHIFSVCLLSVGFSMSSCRPRSSDIASVRAQPSESQDCSAYQPVGEPVEWFRAIKSQKIVEQVFRCSKTPEILPTGRGRGYGSLFSGLSVWNELQLKVGAYIWGGKIFSRQGSDTVLVNIMVDGGNLRYNAKVDFGTSIFDREPTVVLDYRGDKSAAKSEPVTEAQKAVDAIIHGIRDEIREMQSNGKGTGVYIGRANLLNQYKLGDFTDRGVSSNDFINPDKWFFAANFLLDFRQPEEAPKVSASAKDQRPETSVVTRQFKAQPQPIYDAISSFDILPKIFSDTGFLPGVAESRLLSLEWGKVGSQRKVIFNDRNSLIEEMKTLRPGEYYEYEISTFTNFLKFMARSGRGEWWFEREGDRTNVKWQYSFLPISEATRPALKAFLQWHFKDYMEAAIIKLDANLN